MAIRKSLNNIEEHLKSVRFQKALPLLLRRYGIDVNVARLVERPKPVDPALDNNTTEDVYKHLFGTYGDRAPIPSAEHPDDTDDSDNVAFVARILLSDATFTTGDDVFAGDFQDNFIYTLDTLQPGDRFTVIRPDGVKKSWKIDSPDVVGLTRSVFNRFKIIAVVD